MKKKAHHFIAQTYLNSFSNAEGKVCMYQKDDPHNVIRQRPERIAKHKHYYRQPVPKGGFDHNSIEDLFSQVEAKWPDIIRRLRMKEDVNDCLEDIFQFIALHRVRVPAARDACETILAETVRLVGRHLDHVGELPPLPKALEHLGNVWNHVEVAIDPHQSIHAMVAMLRGMAKLVEKIGIGALHNSTDVPFLTSDNPVIWFDPSVSKAELRPYAIRIDGPITLLFPVSPDLLIYGHSSMRDQFAVHGFGYGDLSARSTVEEMNALVCQFAYEAVFASVDTFTDLVAKYADKSPVVRTQAAPTKDGQFILSQYVWGKRTRKPKWNNK